MGRTRTFRAILDTIAITRRQLDALTLPDNMLDLDLNLLRPLWVLLEERHVSNAANRLGISQPAMSRTLQRRRSATSCSYAGRGVGTNAAPEPTASSSPYAKSLHGLTTLFSVRDFCLSNATRRFVSRRPTMQALFSFRSFLNASFGWRREPRSTCDRGKNGRWRMSPADVLTL